MVFWSHFYCTDIGNEVAAQWMWQQKRELQLSKQKVRAADAIPEYLFL